MITYDNLQQSIYGSNYFEKPSSDVSISEKQNKNKKDTLTKVEIVTKGTALSISNSLLKDSSNAYKKIDANISLKKDCDGILLVEKDSKHYLVLIELKSHFNSEINKAIYQIATSDVRIKHKLSAIDTYIPNEYQEIGVVISFPPKNEISDNDVIERRNNFLTGIYDSVTDRCKHKFKKGESITLQPSDFPELAALNISRNINISNLHLFNVQVQEGASSATVNLDELLP